MVKPDDAAALAAAKASGERTEVLDKRGVDLQVFAEPDGTMTAEVSPEPVRAKDESGDWAPIDLTLEHVDGRLAPRNVPGDVTLSAGGDRAFAKANPAGDGTAQDIVWQWPTTLPEPVIDGPTATYRDVAAGAGDLVVIATATGFTHNVVLHEPPAPGAAPVEFTIPVITPGAEISEAASGALELKDTGNGAKLVTAPTPVMWDSSGTDTTDPDVEPVTTKVVDTAAGSNLVLTPSPDFLTDPDTEYPVTIDPSFTQSANGDTWIQSAEYTTSQGGSEELRAGTYDSGDHIARSYLQFPSAPFTGKDIRGASLWIRNHFSKSCTAAAINATRIIEPWSVSNLTWANRPNFTNADMGQFSTAYGADGCPADGAHWDVTEIVKGWANGTFPNYGIQLRANNETWTATWRKYRSINYPDPDVGPRLVVNYYVNTAPTTPTEVNMSPITNGDLVTVTPTLEVLVTDPDVDTLQAEFAIYQGTTPVWNGTSPPTASGTRAGVAVPSGVLSAGATYTVKARVSDGQAASGWTPTRSVVTREVAPTPNIVKKYAPRVRLHPDEPWGPMSANTFINHSDLDFVWDEWCDDGDEMDTSPSQTALGDGGYRDKAKNRFPYCDDIGTWFYSNMLTRPWEKDSGFGTPGGDGFRLDLEKAYRDGQGFEEPGGEPVYWQMVSRKYIVYWFHWGFSRTLKLWDHEGDWERIAVQLNDQNEAVAVEYFAHHGSCTLPWYRVPKVVNHPRVWAVKEAHGSWPAGADTNPLTDNISGDGELWVTQLNLDRVVDMPWYGYGGGWGETGNGNNSSGPLGPSPWKPKPTFPSFKRCDMYHE